MSIHFIRASFSFGFNQKALVFRFCRILFPHTESPQRLISHQRNHRLVTVFYLAVYFLIDKLIIETDLGSILSVVGIIDTMAPKHIGQGSQEV